LEGKFIYTQEKIKLSSKKYLENVSEIKSYFKI
jgi:hypothetical protein